MEKLKKLKAKKMKLLNKAIDSMDKFIETQQKLNELDIQIMVEENQDHIPHID